MSESCEQKNRLIWIDLEMTGLDVDKDSIIEVALIVTDYQLNTIAESPVIAIHQPDSVLEGMDAWNTKQHTSSGLVDRVRASSITHEDAQKTCLEFLKALVKPGVSPMCGNSICQDRRFLHREMPLLEKYFHYRHLDVSTFKIVSQMWYPHLDGAYKKKPQHLALADIKDSIDELKFYRENILK